MNTTRIRLIARATAVATLLALGACATPSGGGAESTGRMAPAEVRSVLIDTKGKPHDIGATLASGKRVALVFWQPWCGSCKAEAPVASHAARKYAGELEVLGVVSGPEGEVNEDQMNEALYSWGMTYPSVRDTSMALTKALHIEGTPTIVVIDTDGNIAYQGHTVPAEWDIR